MTERVVVAIAGDAGGAAAIGPVIEQLRADEHVRVVALAYRQAATAWVPRGIAFESINEACTEEDARRLLARHGTAALLVSTSMNGIDLERMFVRVGRSMAIPSIAVLDMWSKYSERFGAVAGVGPDVPDRVAVMDARALRAMMDEGFPRSQLVVTGHPAFDDVLRAQERFGKAERQELRTALGVADGERLVLFASQPLSLMWGADFTEAGHPGYTEQTVLDVLPAAVARTAGKLGQRVAMLIRPHPREATLAAPHISDGNFRAFASRLGVSRDVAMVSDIVLGMCTILLVEAALLGIPTASIQPGLRTNDTLPSVNGLTRVFRMEELDGALEALFLQESKRTHGVAPTGTVGVDHLGPDENSLLRGGAASAVAEIVYGLVREHS